MNATLSLSEAESLAQRCVARHANRYGLDQDTARDRVAGYLGWSPGTLYNLLRRRLKKLDGDLRADLTAYAIKDLRDEIAALGRELEDAERLGRPQILAMAEKAAGVLAEAQVLHERIMSEVGQ